MTIDNQLWDAIIVGAGVAGTVAAATLAERGWRILLVEKAAWPRDKACGGCLNAAGIALLEKAGLQHVLHGAGALDQMELRAGRRTAAFSLPRGAVVQRPILDARLAAAAVERGCTFLAEAPARLLRDDSPDFRAVQIGSTDSIARGRVVLACGGLGKTGTGFLAGELWATVRMAPRGRLGFSTTVGGTGWALAPGTLRMCVGAEGYAGIVGLPPQPGDTGTAPRLHIGAALLPAACHARRGPAAVIEKILRSCGHDTGAEILASAPFVGTGMLTRRRQTVGRSRVLVIGDACGYVEPFTGEGMAWAIRGALAACELLPARPEEVAADIGAQWQRRFETEMLPRQKWCRGLRHVLGNQPLTALGVRAARMVPWGARQIARQISAG